MPLKGLKGTYSTAVAEDATMTKQPLDKASARLSKQEPQETIVPELVEFEELSDDEAKERLRLERKVERAFYEAGKALYELRERRLYRSSHKTFEAYCADRFAFKRRHPYQLMNAAEVFDNLLNSDLSSMCAVRAQNETGEMTTNRAQNDDNEMCTNRAQNETEQMCANRAQNDDEKMCANRTQILPTSEWQVRPLTKLQPEQQVEAWTQAVEHAGGKVPSHRIVKSIVSQIRERRPVPNPWRVGEVGMIMVKDNPDLRGKGGCWCVITAVHNFSCAVRLWDGEYLVKPEHLKALPYAMTDKDQKFFLELGDRLSKIYDPEMEETAKAILASLGKIERPWLTELEERLLTVLEENQGKRA